MPTTKAMKGDAASVCQGGSMLEPITGTFTADMALESDREGVVERSKGESVWRRARRRRGRSGAKLGGRGATQLRRAWSVVPGRARRTRVPFDSTVVRLQESESTRGAQPTGLRQRGQVGESRESGGRVRKRLDAPSAPSADRSHALVTGSGTQSSFRGSSVALSRRTCLGGPVSSASPPDPTLSCRPRPSVPARSGTLPCLVLTHTPSSWSTSRAPPCRLLRSRSCLSVLARCAASSCCSRFVTSSSRLVCSRALTPKSLTDQLWFRRRAVEPLQARRKLVRLLIARLGDHRPGHCARREADSAQKVGTCAGL